MKKYYILILSLAVATNSIFAQSSELSDIATTAGSQAYTSYSLDDALFEKSPHVDVAKTLYGALPGVLVTGVNATSTSNQASLTIHGKTPLVLIDGFKRDISDVYNAEIENITVLKDAASLALYGTEGANGVILIETKRGKNQRLKVTANYQFGISSAFRAPEFADAYTYATNYNAARVSDGLSAKYSDLELAAFKSGGNTQYSDVDWMKEIYNDYGYNHSLNFTFQGGSDKFRYYTMIDYMKDTALYKSDSANSNYSTDPTDSRLAVRANIDVDVTPTTLLNFGVMARVDQSNLSAGASDASSAAFNTPSAAFPVYLENGVYGSATGYDASNPVALLNSTGVDNTTTTTMIANVKLTQKLDVITEGLSASISAAFDYSGGMYDNIEDDYQYGQYSSSYGETPAYTYYSEDPTVLTYENEFNALRIDSEVDMRFTYARAFDAHSVNAALVYYQNASIMDGQNESYKHQSAIARAAYSYDDRYSVDLVANYSGVSYLAEGSRFNLYPAVSAGWTVSNEDFFGSSDFLSRLKLSASYGLSAIDTDLTYGLTESYYASTGNVYYWSTSTTEVYGSSFGDLAAQDLKPEQSERLSVGLDMGLFKNKVNIFAEYFQDKRTNQLVTVSSYSGVLGVDTKMQSIGATNYAGVDFGVSFADRKGDFGYGIQVTGSYYTSEIIENGEAFQAYDYLYQKGNSVNQNYGLEAIGFFSDAADIANSPTQSFSDVSAGDVKYKDQNGDGAIDSNDIVKMYDTTDPKFNFGVNINLSYKNFELFAAFQGVTGVTKSLLDTGLYDPLVSYGNLSTYFLENEVTWTAATADTATMPRLTSQTNSNNYQDSSLWLRDFSYCKLRNITLAYNLPKDTLKFASAQIYIQGTDLFSIDNIGFTDPEAISSEYYLSTKAYWAGVKFNF